MTQRLCFLTTALMMVCHCVCWAEEKREEKPRLKGVELYGWQEKEGDWIFALLDGTNKLKSTEEVKEAKHKFKNVEELKKALKRLAEGEHVSWIHRINGFEFPSEATQMEIEKTAKEAKLNLHTMSKK